MITLVPLASHAEDLDNILARNTEAHGGEENWDRIENLRTWLTIREPGFEVSGTYTATRSGNMRIDIEADGQRVFSEGLNDGNAWQWTPGEGLADQDQRSAAALRHGIDLPGRFFTLLGARERGASLAFLGEVSGEGLRQWHLRVMLPDGFSRDYFIDQKTGRVVQERDRRAFHPGIDPTKVTVETRYSEPVMIDGVLRYRRSDSYDAETGEWLGTNEIENTVHNVEIPEEYFEPPRD